MKKAREELAAMAFVAAILVPAPEATIENDDPWRLALLRMVDSLDLGIGRTAKGF